MAQKAVMSWSGGKDSALALFEALNSGLEVVGLLTTLTRNDDQISIHGVHRVLLERQAESIGLPLDKMLIRKGAADSEYESELLNILRSYRNKGVISVIFGDIFLEDVRNYREKNITKIGMHGIYPLWKKDTRILANKFIDLGFKAVTTMVDGNVLNQEFVGREYDRQFLSDLPAEVDPCGENGEFHSFVYNGPFFGKPITFKRGKVEFTEKRFWHCELVPTPT